ncbi:MAG: flagellar export chaperone FlgN [Candidatus Delongbacteria bacterium]|nr:flagellar export chaperone FlgN [Candidatus Delongbacteria bacterium]MBN2835702.1 flagellar export chaperone FlgN [Candidatus Delongbacteria bacterium]
MEYTLIELLQQNIQTLENLKTVLEDQRKNVMFSNVELFINSIKEEELLLSTLEKQNINYFKIVGKISAEFKLFGKKKVSEIIDYLPENEKIKTKVLSKKVKRLWVEVNSKILENRVLIKKSYTLISKSLTAFKEYTGMNTTYGLSGNYSNFNQPVKRLVDRNI